MKKYLCLFLVCLAAAGCLMAWESPAKPQAQVHQIGSNLYLLPLYSVNIIISTGKDGVLLIDAGFEQTTDMHLSELRKLGHEDIRYIINTHWHFDHTGGNKTLGRSATIFAHENVRSLLSRDETILGQAQKAYPEHARPCVTFHEATTIYVNGQEIEMIPLIGGHTSGDVLVHFKNENIIHVGDMIFAEMFPFVDVDRGGHVLRLAENLQKLIEIVPEDVRIIPGHGREYDIEDVKNYRRMLLSTTEIVRKEMAGQKDLETMIEADILKDWQSWEGSFRRGDWIGMIYNSLISES